MQFTVQRRLAAEILGCSPKKVRFDETELESIKESITKADIRGLITSGVVFAQQPKGVSRFHARKNQKQKAKGRRRGVGSRKGKATARSTPKAVWMAKVRSQRALLKRMKEKGRINATTYRSLYQKIKGGFFRNQRHIKLYAEEHKLITK